MAASRYTGFSREEVLPLLLIVVAAGLLWNYLGFLWTLPLWPLCLLVLYMFRDPEREIPSSPLAVVSPADGRISAIEQVQDPYLDRDAIRVQIDMFRTGVYATRSPLEGKIMEPKPSNRDMPRGSAPHGVWIKSDEDDDVVVAMSRGPVGNLPKCFVRFGDRVGQGQRCGFLHLGGRIQIYLPSNSRVIVNINDQVNAGSDVIANLVHK